ncbi:Kinesin motor domain containing protein [Aphelenchoides avenae]|nr:Kinesin motor domain containing protein [Aphelenchus avenae]
MSKAKADRPEKGGSRKKNVQVVVRVRPLSDTELTAKARNIISFDSVTKLVNLKDKNAARPFGPFDKIYGPESTQSDLYKDVVAPLINEVLAGYNCTVFAYGQTGSGKTFTMEGRHDDSGKYSWEEDPTAGIIPRALHHIFTELEKQELDEYSVRASYIEMYNEHIYDLLSGADLQESLRIFESKEKGIIIGGMEEVPVRSRDEVYGLLKKGAERRRTASTLMNLVSSRSHSVFTVTVMLREPDIDGEELLRQGKIHLVDLAGSENIGRSGAVDARAREAGNINVSLLALGRVITALTSNAPHVPYRESKLTRILQDSLGGKTITTLISTLSPASTNLEESVNTLEYAQRAKNIKNNPEVNQRVTRKALLREYNEEIERLRRDLLAARTGNGIYLDKENYDGMMADITDKSAQIEELEGQLGAQLHKMQILVQDMTILDEHYQRVYERCQKALKKLENRRKEVEGLKRDVHETNQSLKAAKFALEASQNTATRLRAQALQLKEMYTVCFIELEALHDKLDTFRKASAENDHLMGEFTAKRIHAISQAKSQVTDYATDAKSRMGTLKITIEDSKKSSLDGIASVAQLCEAMREVIAKFGQLAQERYEEYADGMDNTGAMFLSSVRMEMAQLLELNSETVDLLSSLKSSVSTLCSAVVEQSALQHGATRSYREQLEEKNAKFSQLMKQMTENLSAFGQLHASLRTADMSYADSVDEFARQAQATVERSSAEQGALCEKAVGNHDATKKTYDSLLKQCDEFVETQGGVTKSFVQQFNGQVDDVRQAVEGHYQEQVLVVEKTSEGIKRASENITALGTRQLKATDHLSKAVLGHLNETQTGIEHFVHQEVRRVPTTGGTPVRRKDNFDEELEEVAKADFLLSQAPNTPRRTSFFRTRESILEGDLQAISLSPSSLKSKLEGFKIDPSEECAQYEASRRLKTIKESAHSSRTSSDD